MSNNGYYLIIDTDGDFGLIIEDQKFYQEEIKIYAYTFEKLKELVNNIQVFEINPGKTYYGENLIRKLRAYINNNIQSSVFGGNNNFEYGPMMKDFDIIK